MDRRAPPRANSYWEITMEEAKERGIRPGKGGPIKVRKSKKNERKKKGEAGRGCHRSEKGRSFI